MFTILFLSLRLLYFSFYISPATAKKDERLAFVFLMQPLLNPPLVRGGQGEVFLITTPHLGFQPPLSIYVNGEGTGVRFIHFFTLN